MRAWRSSPTTSTPIPPTSSSSSARVRCISRPPTSDGTGACRSTNSSVTLGEDQHEKAIGVILSGSGADGAVGFRSIVQEGGLVIVQQPETAQFDGMPKSAIRPAW